MEFGGIGYSEMQACVIVEEFEALTINMFLIRPAN